MKSILLFFLTITTTFGFSGTVEVHHCSKLSRSFEKGALDSICFEKISNTKFELTFRSRSETLEISNHSLIINTNIWKKFSAKGRYLYHQTSFEIDETSPYRIRANLYGRFRNGELRSLNTSFIELTHRNSGLIQKKYNKRSSGANPPCGGGRRCI